MSSLLNHMRTQANALNDPTSGLGNLISQWFGSWGSWRKELSPILEIVLICVFSCILICIVAVMSTSIAVKQVPRDPLHASDAPHGGLRAHCRRGRHFGVVRAGQVGYNVGERDQKDVTADCPMRWASGTQRRPTCSSVLGMWGPLAFLAPRVCSKDTAFRW